MRPHSGVLVHVPNIRDRSNEQEEPSEAEIMARVRALIEAGHGAEVRTLHGSWRSVVAVYSDRTVGTTRVDESGPIGRFTVLEADRITAVRSPR